MLVLAGCRNTENQKAGSSSETTSAVAEPRELKDFLGNQVSVPATPKRVIGSYLEDYLVALGVTPVAQWSVNDGKSIQNYLEGSLKNVPTIAHDLPFEAVTSFKPDLLLISSSGTVEGGKYDQYAKIAPTYVVENGETVNWRDQLIEVGNVLNKKADAEKVLKEYDEKTKTAKADIKKATAGESAAVIWVVNNAAFMVSEKTSSGAVLYGELGLKVPNLVKEISEKATANWSAVSLEKLAELDADNIFLVNSDRANGAAMLEDAIWKNIPAVKNGRVYEFGPETSWLYTGPIANGQIIDDV